MTIEDNGPDHEMLQDILRLTLKAIFLIGRCIYYYAMTIPLFAIVSTRQEYKIWKATPYPLTLFGIIKVFLYNFLWMGICLISTIALFPLWAQRGFGNSVQVETNAVFEKLIAYAVHTALVGTVEVVHAERIPPIELLNGSSPAPVFIANHCSQLDISCIYYAVRRFKWIAKQSVKMIPGPGNLMALGGHVFIQRTGKNRGSVSNLYQQSNNAIQEGIPMVFFPQGTRRMSTKLPFKDGAFRVALENESMIVPITINVPPNAWNSSYPLNLLWGRNDENETSRSGSSKIVMTIHEPIQVKKEMDLNHLKEQCQEIIYSKLPSLYHGSISTGGTSKEQSKQEKKTN